MAHVLFRKLKANKKWQYVNHFDDEQAAINSKQILESLNPFAKEIFYRVVGTAFKSEDIKSSSEIMLKNADCGSCNERIVLIG